MSDRTAPIRKSRYTTKEEKAAIRAWLEGYRLKLPPEGVESIPDLVATIIAALEFKVTYHTVRTLLDEMGIPYNLRNSPANPAPSIAEQTKTIARLTQERAQLSARCTRLEAQMHYLKSIQPKTFWQRLAAVFNPPVEIL
jgi:hypothetical protein